MNTAQNSLSSPLRALVASASMLLALAALPACGTRLTPTVAQVDGHAVELVETGAGDTTVIFESGLGDDWAPWEAVASESRGQGSRVRLLASRLRAQRPLRGAA